MKNKLREMIGHARNGNMVRFNRTFKEAIAEKVPAAIEKQRHTVANKMFNRQ